MAEPTFFESLLKTLKIGEKPKTSTKDFTLPESIPIIGGKTVTLSNEFSEEQEKFMSEARESNERNRRRRESIIQEAANEAAQEAATEPAVVATPTPPEPPAQGQANNEESTGSAQTNEKAGTIVADKILDPAALRKRRSLMSRVKKGLLADDEQMKMLT
tara:strand:- start:803 stop:1282 length:480 start_codon:yes stop_codon:yes gene_type:complete